MALFVNSQQLKAHSGQKWSTSGNITSNGDFIGTSNMELLPLGGHKSYYYLCYL